MPKERRKKDWFGGIMNLLMLVMMIPIITSALGGISDDPTILVLVGLLPVLMIFNAIGDFI